MKEKVNNNFLNLISKIVKIHIIDIIQNFVQFFIIRLINIFYRELL